MTHSDLRPARILRILSWLIAAWITWEFLYYEQFKLTGNPGSIEGVFQPLATWFGFPAQEKVIRLGVASLEITASILVLIYPTRVIGAFLAFGIMAGAIFFHTVGPIGIDPYGDGGKLFKEALVTLFAAGVILCIHRAEATALIRSLLRRVTGGPLAATAV